MKKALVILVIALVPVLAHADFQLGGAGICTMAISQRLDPSPSRELVSPTGWKAA